MLSERQVSDATAERPALIIGRYALYGVIAQGGMAKVHYGRARGPVGFTRTVAVKRLHSHYMSEPEFVSMLLDEARLSSRIRHPNVVPVLDVVAEQGELLLVMEYVHSESLARLVARAGERNERPSASIASGVLVPVLHGLHAAHTASSETGEPLNLVHRDFTPQNILVDSDGVPRVVDFGVARAGGRLYATTEGKLKGKPAYMAPEQIRGEINDRRIDVFSAAVVLWEMLTLRRLFGGTSHANTLNKVLSGVIDKPSRINRDVTPELDAVVMKGLERNPERRFQTARDFALALEEAAPLASPVKLAAWVDALASDALKERAETIEAIERSDHGSTGPAEPTPTTNAGVERSREPGPNETLHEAASTIVFSVPPRRFSGAWLAIAFLVAGLALGAMVFWSPFREQPSSLNRSWSGQRAWPAMTAASVTSPALSAIPSATVTAKRVPAKERGSTSKGRSKDCTPPYTTDARGVQVWKSHCK